jgi:outer membrane protein OmpA-like peptidoglycan-associated protein
MRPLILVLFFSLLALQSLAQGSEPVVLISGKVVNERTMEPLEARVIWEILPDGTEAGIARTDPLTGEYKIILPFGKKYGYMGFAEGYYSVTKNLDVSKLTEYTEIDEQNLFMAPIKESQVVRINNLFFKGKTAELLDESYPELNRLAEFLKVNKKLVIEIAGHTDNKGNAEDNMKLSKDRAQAVADYLISKGIKAERLVVKGYGQTQPLGFNNDEEGREMNRRVEFRVLSLGK